MRLEIERLARAHEAMQVVGDYLERGQDEAQAQLARAVIAVRRQQRSLADPGEAQLQRHPNR